MNNPPNRLQSASSSPEALANGQAGQPTLPAPQPADSPAAFAIDVQVDEPFAGLAPAARLLAAVEAALSQRALAGGELSLVITGDETLRQLNREYLGIDAVTDVLSFPAQGEVENGWTPFVSAPEAMAYLGDIVISYPQAARQAEAAGHAVADELCLLAIHGALHLLGYDHATAQEEAAMWREQAAALARLDIPVQVARYASAEDS